MTSGQSDWLLRSAVRAPCKVISVKRGEADDCDRDPYDNHSVHNSIVLSEFLNQRLDGDPVVLDEHHLDIDSRIKHSLERLNLDHIVSETR